MINSPNGSRIPEQPPMPSLKFSWETTTNGSHSLFDAVLKQSVKDARVDYAGLKARPQELNRAGGILVNSGQASPAMSSKRPETKS
jgi:hypothetical protein